jgi:hypothetical protein
MKIIVIITISIFVGFFLSKAYYSKPINLINSFSSEEKIILEQNVPWLKEAHGGQIKNLVVYSSKSGKDAIIIDVIKENIVAFLTLGKKGIVRINVTDEKNNYLTLTYEENGTFKDINYSFNEGKTILIDKNADGIYDFKVENGKDYFKKLTTKWSSLEENREDIVSNSFKH